MPRPGLSERLGRACGIVLGAALVLLALSAVLYFVSLFLRAAWEVWAA